MGNVELDSSIVQSINLQGYSGCQVCAMSDSEKIFVRKISANEDYNQRLLKQIKKQESFKHDHIKVPKIYNISTHDKLLRIDMEYIHGKKFSDFIAANSNQKNIEIFNIILHFIQNQIIINKSIQPDVQDKIHNLGLHHKYDRFGEYCLNHDWSLDFASYSHGDLIFENILIQNEDIYFIDFLDSFTSSQCIDISKIMQDLFCFWSWRNNKQPPFTKILILNDVLFKTIDHRIIESSKVMLILNILRIIKYANQKDEDYLYNQLSDLLVDHSK